MRRVLLPVLINGGSWRIKRAMLCFVAIPSFLAQAANPNFSTSCYDAVVSCISCPVGKERHPHGEAGRNEPFPQISRDKDLTNPDSATVLN